MQNLDNLTIPQLKEMLEKLKQENSTLVLQNKSYEQEVNRLNQDISAQTIKEQHAQLLKYNKELEQFTYVATHDLKSPLANIQGYLDLLALEIENPSEDVVDSLKWLKYSVAEARNVIVELTNALKARNNKDELLKTIQLEELVESILSGMRSIILESRIVFITDFTEASTITYYPVALRSILQNIISNAIQYIGENPTPEIKISTSADKQNISIAIADNGTGIDLVQHESKLFGLFKRVSNSGGGTGIGMYIVHNLLNNYGGNLQVESEVGKGSTFTIILPQKGKEHA